MYLPTKFGADIFTQSGVIDIFPKFKMAPAAILDFQVMWIWHIASSKMCGSWALYQIWFKYMLYSLRLTPFCSRHSFDDVIWTNFRFWLLVTWSSLHGCDASSYQIWCRHLYPVRGYWHFSDIQDGGRHQFGFSNYVNLVHSIILIVRCLTSVPNLVQI